MSPSAQTLSGRLSAPFSVATDSTRPPRGARHRGHTSATATAAAAAARSRAALALVLLVSAAAFFFVVAARSARGSGGGAAGTDLDASPFSSTSFSSRPSGRTSVGTKSVPASGAEEQEKKKSDKGVEAATTEEEADEASPSPSSKKSSAPPPPPVPPPQPSVFFARSVREFRHDGSAFTQGLEFDRICSGPHALESSGGGGSCRDVFWESTGEVPLSLSFVSSVSLFPFSQPLPHSLLFPQASTASPRSGSWTSNRERSCGPPSSPTTPLAKA